MKLTSVLILVLSLLFVTSVAGCAAHAVAVPGTIGSTHPGLSHPGTTPHSLSPVATWLDIFMIFAVPMAVAGIVLFWFAPEAHRLSMCLATGGGTLFGVSAILKVTLWLVPWIAGALLLLGALVGGYELYLKFRIPPTEPSAAAKPTPSAMTEIKSVPTAALPTPTAA